MYKYDENGNKIKRHIPRPNQPNYYTYWYRTVCLQRALWAWTYNEVPEGYVVDHISNKHDCLDDYKLGNLRLLTPGQNLAAQRGDSVKQVKCDLTKDLSYYVDRLDDYLIKYNKAKLEGNSTLAHNYRSMIAHIRGQIRYYNENITEEQLKKNKEVKDKKMEERKLIQERQNKATLRKKLRALIDLAKLRNDLAIWHYRCSLKDKLDVPYVKDYIEATYEILIAMKED